MMVIITDYACAARIIIADQAGSCSAHTSVWTYTSLNFV